MWWIVIGTHALEYAWTNTLAANYTPTIEWHLATDGLAQIAVDSIRDGVDAAKFRPDQGHAGER